MIFSRFSFAADPWWSHTGGEDEVNTGTEFWNGFYRFLSSRTVHKYLIVTQATKDYLAKRWSAHTTWFEERCWIINSMLHDGLWWIFFLSCVQIFLPESSTWSCTRSTRAMSRCTPRWLSSCWLRWSSPRLCWSSGRSATIGRTRWVGCFFFLFFCAWNCE